VSEIFFQKSLLQTYSEIGLQLTLFIFLGAFLIQLIYQTWFGSRLFFYKKYKKKQAVPERKPVSVVITARNEAQNLKAFLPQILTQDYPEFEVIVVNDASTDETAEVLEELSLTYKNLYSTAIPLDEKFSHSKKLALTIGIKAARFDWVLLTDADCVPDSPQWLARMQSNFVPEYNFILGYGAYKRMGGFLNKMIRTDTIQIAINYLTYAMAGVPYMGVGRNMAFRKSVFFEKKGFASHYKLDSGSDDLFVNEAAKGKETRVELAPESFTSSLPQPRLLKWIKQKRRHLTTGGMYKWKHKLLLGTEILSRYVFYFLLPVALYITSFHPLVLAVASLRFLLMFIIWFKALWMFRQKDLWWTIILFDLAMPFINFLIYLSNKIVFPRKAWR